MKTKVLPVILSLVMAITMGLKSKLYVSAVNVKGSMVDEQGVAFTLYDDGTATVLGPIDRPAYGTKFVIPAEINGYRVTEIANSAFDGGMIVEISPLNNIEIIGKRAFNRCIIPAGETILDHLKEIGGEAFLECSFSGKKTENDGVKLDGDDTDHLSEFGTIDISKSSLTTLGYKTFSYCRGLREVRLPENLSNLNCAFKYCFDLENLDIPAGVTKLNEFEFFNCEYLRLDKLPPNLTEIGECAFGDCMCLRFQELPASVNKIGKDAFNGVRMEKLTLPYGLTEIPAGAFMNAHMNLVNIPITIESIGSSAFSNSDITSINCEAGSGIVNLPNGVKSIGKSAFEDCEGIKSINIPSSVSEIGERAFANCINLTAINALIDSGIINLPSGVESIGKSAFGGCEGIELINIPNSVSETKKRAFAGCLDLTEPGLLLEGDDD